MAFVRVDPAHADTVTTYRLQMWRRDVMATYKLHEVDIVEQSSLTATSKVGKVVLEELL